MTAFRLGVVALAVLAVHYMTQAVHMACVLFSYVFRDGAELANVVGTGIWLALQVLLGLLLLRHRRRISGWLFRVHIPAAELVSVEDDRPAAEHPEASGIDTQVAALAVLGVWLVATGLPPLFSCLIWVPDPGPGSVSIQAGSYPLGQLLSPAARIGMGLFLVLRGRLVVDLWCQGARTSQPVETSP